MTPALDSIDWHRFLDRPRIPAAPESLLASISREPILITGAGGSIGSALALRLAAAGARLILLEASENNLFDLQSEFARAGCDGEFHLGSISDTHLLEEIFARHIPRIVFHAAAFKHVPLLETQPFAAIANNIFATQALVATASTHRSRLILLSTDKAVEPASLLGATKRVAEQIVLASGGTVLRLANVLGSRGSVAEVFARQIAAGTPLTVTDPAARRYFLTIAEAVDLLLASVAVLDLSRLLIPDLRSPRYIADLARFMARTLAPGRDIPIEFTHPRPGDKEAEALFSHQEVLDGACGNGLIPVDSPTLPPATLRRLLEELKAASQSRDLSAVLSTLRRLVPDYTPSQAVQSMLSATETPIRNG